MKSFRNSLAVYTAVLWKRETLIAFLIAVGAASFSLLPTIYAWLNTPEGYWFTGVSSFFDPWDINTYFAAMRQGFDGSWLYRSPYPPNPSTAIPIHMDYLFLGHLARVLHLSIPLTYHLTAFILGIIFLLAVYLFVRSFLKDKFWGRFCLYLVAFGGGFGFMALGVLPDTAWPDATVFQTLHLPNFILDQLLFLGILFFSQRSLTKSQWSDGLWTAVLGLGLGLVHPYSLFVADVVVGLLLIALWLRDRNWQPIKFLLPLAFVSIAAVGYFFKIFYLDKWYTGSLLLHKAPVRYATPSMLILFLGYGLLAVFAVAGAHRLLREKGLAAPLLLSWFFGQLLVLYFPVSWQRIMIKSFFIVICLLAVWGMRALRLRENKVALAMILFLSILSNLTLQIYTVAIAQKDNPWVYLTVGEHDALVWLQQNSRGQTVLAPLQLATMIPANSNDRVHLAYQDARFDEEAMGRVEDFYQGKLELPQEFLREGGIDYVMVDVDKSSLGEEDYLEKVYENAKVKIFKVL